MAKREFIKNTAENLISKYDTRDPFELCKAVGVYVLFADLGSLKCMYKYLKKNRFAIINENLDPDTKRLVCAHELGHDQLHLEIAKHICLQEFALYDMKNRPEYEANLFAAEILLPDELIVVHAHEGYDIEQIAKELSVDINLVALKVSSMNMRGYKLNETMSPKFNFLKL